MKVTIIVNHSFEDGHTESEEKEVQFKWNGTEFVMTSKAFNPNLDKVFISPYNMKIMGQAKNGITFPLYGKYVADVKMIVDVN